MVRLSFWTGLGVMALSEGEQRRLEEMERALERDDPRFATSVSVERVRRCRLITGGAVFLLGAFVQLAGLVATAGSTPVGVVIGVAGFLIMVAAAVTLLFPARRRRG